ncbi:MAG: transglutaminaseTgpA domain-containing protein [Acidimicrobiales bacterium]
MSTRLALPPRPVPPPAGGDITPGPARSAATSRSAAGWAPAGSEVALLAVTAAAVVGLSRLFSDGDFLGPCLVAAVGGHGLASGLRRRRVNAVAATVASGIGLLVVCGWVVESRSLTLGLPLAGTWHAIRADLGSAATRFGQVRAPTPAVPSFILACVIATWVVAVAADAFAFRARTRFEALAPSFVLFLFGAVVGAEQFRLATSGLYLAAVLVFVVAADASRRPAPAWFGGRAGDGDRALLRSGLATAVVAVLVAMVAGPRLPGASDLGLLGWRNGSERSSGSRTTISPLVDIRNRLIDQSGVELFTVDSPVASYWRMTSLERFDGTIWSSVGSYQPAKGHLPTGPPTKSADELVTQQFDVESLSAIWLPAAYQARRLDGVSRVRWDPDSSSLLTDADTSDKLRYTVQSALPKLDAAQLDTSPASLSSDMAARYLDLPSGFPARVRALAATVTKGTPATCQALGCSAAERASGTLTPFHQARALQDWFRADFQYDLTVPAGHDDSAIEHFLFDTRRGYCEQFAGSFAAMARALGLPSRVAVGFTPGTKGDDGKWHVTDREAHAWPEVWLAPYGWVAFEPTPTRAIPGADAYTGLNGASASTGTDAAGATAATSATTAPPSAGAGPDTTEAAAPQGSATTGSGRSGLPLPSPLGLVAAAVVLYLVAVPLAHRARRARRRAGASGPTGRVLAAWADVQDDLALAGVGRRPAETATEYAARARSGAAGMGPAVSDLAGYVSAAAFSPTGADEATAARAEASARAVHDEVACDVRPSRRAARSLDPRPLVGAGAAAVRARRRARPPD